MIVIQQHGCNIANISNHMEYIFSEIMLYVIPIYIYIYIIYNIYMLYRYYIILHNNIISFGNMLHDSLVFML